eukprot:TRINITY_DN1077_c0_g1_i1.p1 TRINITY_DN1077_c0_g1~~TRINITY_DN1077_c0_g1_i1.p1  ORF type:complete len:107 (+),score=8.02 TRINITY_DN1077_c0_g1_i1:269-589(+)
MVHPRVNAMLLTPICPFSISGRPALLPDDVCLWLKIRSGSFVQLAFDGKAPNFELTLNDKIIITRSKYSVRTVNKREQDRDWMKHITSLLYWNLDPKNHNLSLIHI